MNLSILSYIRAILLIGLLLPSCLYVQAQEKKNIEIGVLFDKAVPEAIMLLGQLQTEIKAVVGEDAEITFPEEFQYANDYNPEKAKQNFEAASQSECDILLVFGMIDNVVLSSIETFPKPTIMFGAAPQEFAGLNPEPHENLIFLTDANSFSKDLDALKSIYSFKHIGIALEQPLIENFDLKQLFDSYTGADVSYTLIPFYELEDILPKLDSIDALYLGGGFLMGDEDITTLANTLIEKKIPNFTATGVHDVDLGLLATLQSPTTLEQIFRRIALNVESVINGYVPSGRPSYLDSEDRLSINFEVAERLGLSLKFSLLATSNILGDLSRIEAEKEYNLREVMQEVVQRNLALNAGLQNVALATQDLKTAKSNYYPNLNASWTGNYVEPKLARASNGQNPEFSTVGTVGLQQTLFSPAVSANIRIQKELQYAEQENYNSAKLDAYFNAANAYFNVLLLKTNLKISARNLAVTERNVEIAQQKYEAGETDKTDILRFRSEKAQNTQQLVEAINQHAQSIIALNQLLNQPLDRKIDVVEVELGMGIFKEYNYEEISDILDNPDLIQPFVEFLVDQAKTNSPELRALSASKNAADFGLKLAKYGRFVPTVALQAQYQNTLTRSGVGTEFPMGFPALPNGFFTGGLSVSLPIFQQNQQNINLQTAQIQINQLQLNIDNTNLSLDQVVLNSILQLSNQISNLYTSVDAADAAQEGLELTQDAYAKGAVDRVLLIDIQNNYFQAQLAKATAVYNYLLSLLQLERNIGYFFLLNSPEENEAFRQKFLTYLENR